MSTQSPTSKKIDMSYKPNYKYIPPIKWAVLTPLYDFFCVISGLGSRLRAKVLNSVQLRDNMAVVDVGCGTGVFLMIAKRRYPRVQFIGLDPDKKALAIAQRRLARAAADVELKEAFAEQLPLRDESVDVVYSTLAFHHMPNSIKQQAIKEIHRVLRYGGKIVIADFGETQSHFFRKMLFFEKLEYIEGNFNGLILGYLKESQFRDSAVIGRHFSGIDIVVAEK